MKPIPNDRSYKLTAVSSALTEVSLQAPKARTQISQWDGAGRSMHSLKQPSCDLMHKIAYPNTSFSFSVVLRDRV